VDNIVEDLKEIKWLGIYFSGVELMTKYNIWDFFTR
jgi:hypothetical protein